MYQSRLVLAEESDLLVKGDRTCTYHLITFLAWLNPFENLFSIRYWVVIGTGYPVFFSSNPSYGGWGGFAPAVAPELHQARYYLRDSTIFCEVGYDLHITYIQRTNGITESNRVWILQMPFLASTFSATTSYLRVHLISPTGSQFVLFTNLADLINCKLQSGQ